MATVIRHGANGSYKSASAVWFDVLPALREGRVVVTNIEGMQDLKTIESRLGERFPMTARIIRISSMNENGIKLWQHWYNWCPVGALILIDEAQDIYNKTVGFDMGKNVFLGIEKFSEMLPKGYIDFYKDQLANFKPDEVTLDDLGESVVDDTGNVILPMNFNMAFKRHRKYNWDITLCTPDIKEIPAEIKGCSELAIHQASKDSTFFARRKPRLWEHNPKSTTTKPAKDDVTRSVKVPKAVHLMYSSTVTGHTTKSGVASSLLAQPKFILFLVMIVVVLFFFLRSVYEIVTRDSVDDSVPSGKAESAQIDSDSVPAGSVPADKNQTIPNVVPQTGDDIRHGVAGPSSSSARGDRVFVDSPLVDWPYDIAQLFVSGVHIKFQPKRKTTHITVIFEQHYPDGRRGYVYSDTLKQLGYEFQVLDPCMVKVSYNTLNDVVMCNPVNEVMDLPDEPRLEVASATQDFDAQPLGALIDGEI